MRKPVPDSAEWWREVAEGLGVEIQRLRQRILVLEGNGNAPLQLTPFSETQAYSDDWLEPEMPEGFFWMVCCDCGKAHRVYVRVVDGRAQWRFSADDEATDLFRSRSDYHFRLSPSASEAPSPVSSPSPAEGKPE